MGRLMSVLKEFPAFFEAVVAGDLASVRRLLETYRDASMITPGQSPLSARPGSQGAVADFALKGAYVGAQTGDLPMLKLCIEFGASLEGDVAGGPLLYSAASMGHVEVIGYLIEQGASVNAVCASGTPLSGASLGRRYDAMRLLLDSGANIFEGRADDESVNTLVDEEGNDALDWIKINDDPAAFREFVERGLIPVDTPQALLDWVLAKRYLDVSRIVMMCIEEPALAGQFTPERLHSCVALTDHPSVQAVLLAEASRLELMGVLDHAGDESLSMPSRPMGLEL
jgi:hypothetical protein